MSIRSLGSAEWLVIARFALMGLEMLLVKAHLVRGHYEWRDTLASIGMRAGNYLSNVLLAGAVVARVPHGPGRVGTVGAEVVTVSPEGRVRRVTPALQELGH